MIGSGDEGDAKLRCATRVCARGGQRTADSAGDGMRLHSPLQDPRVRAMRASGRTDSAPMRPVAEACVQRARLTDIRA